MKIWVITSWVDMLVLFRFLAKHNFQYEIVYDDLGRPWTDKPVEFMLERAGKAMDYLIKQGVKHVIVPPVVEVSLTNDKTYWKYILPLWQSYLLHECMPSSAVWKIGFAGEYGDLHSKELYEKLCTTYSVNETQQARNKWKLSFRRKEISMWKYYLQKIGFKSQIVHHSMKADFRYFKDALVDTIVPTSYGFFAYETMLGKFLNTKKQRFHWLGAIERQFDALAASNKLAVADYGVHIHYTGTLDLLLREKKRMRMLGRGKEVQVESRKIILE